MNFIKYLLKNISTSHTRFGNLTFVLSEPKRVTGNTPFSWLWN